MAKRKQQRARQPRSPGRQEEGAPGRVAEPKPRERAAAMAGLASLCFRRAGAVVLAFVVLALLCLSIVPQLGDTLLSSGLVTIDDSESSHEAALEQHDFQFSEEIANFSFHSPKAKADDEPFRRTTLAAVQHLASTYPELLGVAQVPWGDKLMRRILVSQDEHTVLARVPVYGTPSSAARGLERVQDDLDELDAGRKGRIDWPDSVVEGHEKDDMQVHVLSQSLVTAELIDGVASAALLAIAIAAIPLLLLILAGCARWGGLIPVLACTVIAGIVALGVIAALGQVVTLDTFGVAVLALVCLGAGVSQSMLAYRRYADARDSGASGEAAIAETGRTTLRATVAGTIVSCIGVLPLLLLPAVTYRSFAVAGIVAILAVGLTTACLLPALLGLLGNTALSGRIRAAGASEERGESRLSAFLSAVMRRSALAVAAAIVVGVVLATVGLGIHPGTGGIDLLPEGTSQRKAAKAVEKAFTAGLPTPTVIVVDTPGSLLKSEAAYETARKLQARIAADPDTFFVAGPGNVIPTVASMAPQISPSMRKTLDELEERDVSALTSLGTESAKAPPESSTEEREAQLEATNLALDLLPGMGAQLRAVVDAHAYRVTIVGKPASDKPAALDYVKRVRQYVRDTYPGSGPPAFSSGTEAVVGGLVASSLDVTTSTRDLMPVVLGLIALLLVIALSLALRSPLAALLVVCAEALVALGAFGILVGLFQWGWFGFPGSGYVEAEIPIMLLPVLLVFSTGDLLVFLERTRDAEEASSLNARSAFVESCARHARAGLAASASLFILFAAMALTGSLVVAQVGVAFAAAVALDLVLVRGLLAPAVVARLGNKLWNIPDWLDSTLPGGE